MPQGVRSPSTAVTSVWNGSRGRGQTCSPTGKPGLQTGEEDRSLKRPFKET